MDLGIEGKAALVVAGVAGPGSGHGRGPGRRGGPGDGVVARRRRPAGRAAAAAAVRRGRGGHHGGRHRRPGAPARLVGGHGGGLRRPSTSSWPTPAGPPRPGPRRRRCPARRGPQRQPAVGHPADPGGRPAHAGRTDGGGSAASPPTRWCSRCRRWPSPTRPGPACGPGRRRRPRTWPPRGAGSPSTCSAPGPTPPTGCRSWVGPGRWGIRPTSAAWPPSSAREQAGFVNGAALVVDGGATLAL